MHVNILEIFFEIWCFVRIKNDKGNYPLYFLDEHKRTFLPFATNIDILFYVTSQNRKNEKFKAEKIP